LSNCNFIPFLNVAGNYRQIQLVWPQIVVTNSFFKTLITTLYERIEVLQFLALETVCCASCSAVSSIWMPPCPLKGSMIAVYQQK